VYIALRPFFGGAFLTPGGVLWQKRAKPPKIGCFGGPIYADYIMHRYPHLCRVGWCPKRGSYGPILYRGEPHFVEKIRPHTRKILNKKNILFRRNKFLNLKLIRCAPKFLRSERSNGVVLLTSQHLQNSSQWQDAYDFLFYFYILFTSINNLSF